MKKLVETTMAFVGSACLCLGGDLCPPSDGGADLGKTGYEWGAVYAKSIMTTNIDGTAANMAVSNLTVGTGGTVTVPADSVSLDAVNGITATAAEINLLTAMKTAHLGSVAVSVATNANGGTNVVTFTGKDLAGTQLTGYHAMTFFVADSTYGAPAAVAGDIIMSGTGVTELDVILDKAAYTVQLSNGVAVATITDDPAGTNYIHTINSAGVVSTPTTSAFNAP